MNSVLEGSRRYIFTNLRQPEWARLSERDDLSFVSPSASCQPDDPARTRPPPGRIPRPFVGGADPGAASDREDLLLLSDWRRDFLRRRCSSRGDRIESATRH